MNVFPIILISVKINTKLLVSIYKCRIEIKKWERRNLQQVGWGFMKPNV